MDDACEPVSGHAERLRAAGLRATRPRRLVLEVLDEIGGHRSADDLVGTLAAQGRPVARATVYNVVDDLTAAGLVVLAGVGPGRAVYEVARPHHHHFRCRSCANVLDLDCGGEGGPCVEPDIPGAVVEDAQVLFSGLCPPCARIGPGSGVVAIRL